MVTKEILPSSLESLQVCDEVLKDALQLAIDEDESLSEVVL